MAASSVRIVGLEEEAATETSSVVTGASESGKKWSDSEILSKLESGDLLEIDNTKSKKEFWKNFRHIIDKHGKKIKRARCKRCKIMYDISNCVNVLSRHSCASPSSAISNTPAISSFFTKQSASISAPTKAKFSKALAYFCAKDMRPFEAVNGEGFKKLLQETLEIGSNHGVLPLDNLIPTAPTIANYVGTLATEMRTKMKNKIQPIFSEFGGAITLDFWSDSYHKHPYLSITGHYIDNDWQLQNVLMGVYTWEPEQRQTAENVQKFLFEKLDEFGISNREKLVFVTDEGANLKKALENESRLNCTAHVLNTALKNVFEHEAKKMPENSRGPEIGNLQSCNDLVSFIRRSHIKSQLTRQVVPDVDTWWHSKVDMIESVLKAWDEIEEILMDRDAEIPQGNDLEKLNVIDRSVLQQIFEIIEPFRVAVLEMEKTSYPTLPGVICRYQKLLNSLTPKNTDENWVQSLKQRLQDGVKKKLLITRDHLAATSFHPSFRLLEIPCIHEMDKRRAYTAVRDLFWHQNDQILDGNTAEENSTANALGSATSSKRCKVSMDSFLDEFCSTGQNYLNDELDRYLADTVTKVSFEDILKWWKIASNTYPKLSAVARKFLAIPATSAASESAFRYAGLTVVSLRNRLAPQTVSDLLFVHHFQDH